MLNKYLDYIRFYTRFQRRGIQGKKDAKDIDDQEDINMAPTSDGHTEYDGSKNDQREVMEMMDNGPHPHNQTCSTSEDDESTPLCTVKNVLYEKGNYMLQ